MSLRKVKTLYCIAVMAIAIVLAVLGHWVGWVTAVVLLSGALPGWRLATRTAASSALIGFRQNLVNEATIRTQSTDPASEDRQAVRR